VGVQIFHQLEVRERSFIIQNDRLLGCRAFINAIFNDQLTRHPLTRRDRLTLSPNSK
jgi:hypothetical protein